MSNNRSLLSMNWQEASSGMWYAETTNYKLVAYERTPEEIAALPTYANDYPCNFVIYEWNDAEQSWIHIAAPMWGVKGTLTDVMHAAESSLGEQIKNKARRIDPGTALFDNVNRILQDFQGREFQRQQRIQDEPRMRGLPPGHPPIGRRNTDRDSAMSIGRSVKRVLESQLFTFNTERDLPPFNFTVPALSDIGPVGKSMKEMEADLKKHLDEKFPDRNKGSE